MWEILHSTRTVQYKRLVVDKESLLGNCFKKQFWINIGKES